MDDAEVCIVSCGITARISRNAILAARKEGIRAGMLRPITLWPFPAQIIRDTAERIGNFLVFEMSTGQMVEDVRLAIQGRARIGFHGRPGGVVPTPVELAHVVMRQYDRKKGIVDPLG